MLAPPTFDYIRYNISEFLLVPAKIKCTQSSPFTKYCFARLKGDVLSDKSDVNGLKENVCIVANLNGKGTTLQKLVWWKQKFS